MSLFILCTGGTPVFGVAIVLGILTVLLALFVFKLWRQRCCQP